MNRECVDRSKVRSSSRIIAGQPGEVRPCESFSLRSLDWHVLDLLLASNMLRTLVSSSILRRRLLSNLPWVAQRPLQAKFRMIGTYGGHRSQLGTRRLTIFRCGQLLGLRHYIARNSHNNHSDARPTTQDLGSKSVSPVRLGSEKLKSIVSFTSQFRMASTWPWLGVRPGSSVSGRCMSQIVSELVIEMCGSLMKDLTMKFSRGRLLGIFGTAARTRTPRMTSQLFSAIPSNAQAGPGEEK